MSSDLSPYLSVATVEGPAEGAESKLTEVLVAAVLAVGAVIAHQGVRHVLHAASALKRWRQGGDGGVARHRTVALTPAGADGIAGQEGVRDVTGGTLHEPRWQRPPVGGRRGDDCRNLLWENGPLAALQFFLTEELMTQDVERLWGFLAAGHGEVVAGTRIPLATWRGGRQHAAVGVVCNGPVAPIEGTPIPVCVSETEN